jgi:hypothetical protein
MVAAGIRQVRAAGDPPGDGAAHVPAPVQRSVGGEGGDSREERQRDQGDQAHVLDGGRAALR